MSNVNINAKALAALKANNPDMAALAKRLDNPIWFMNRLLIKDKNGVLVPFILNDEQRLTVELLMSGKNIVILKARQLGITTVCTAFLFWKALRSKDPISCVSLLHKKDAADEVFLKYNGYYQSLPKLLRPNLLKETSSSMRFKHGSSVQAITAAGHAGLRSYTINLAHISELCFYDDSSEVLSNAISALNGNQLIIESTATAYGDPMHGLVDDIQRGAMPGNWELVFFPWHQHTAYRAEPPVGWEPSAADNELATLHGLTSAQLYWRSCRIAEQGINKFNTEYPATIEDVFSQKGNCYYTDEDLKNVKHMPAIPRELFIEQPVAGVAYAIGVDVAAGTLQDYSAICVLSQKTGDPVYIYRSNSIAPTELARKIQTISTFYNRAKTLVEANNWGHTVINELEHLGFTSFYKTASGKHWETTSTSKMTMHEQLKEAIRRGSIGVLDEITVTELKGLIVTNQSKAPESQRTKQGHGDNVIALGLAYQCLLTLPKPAKPMTELEKIVHRNAASKNPHNKQWR